MSIIATIMKGKKVITLYQVPKGNAEGFINNMLGRYTQIDDMEPVYRTIMSGEDEDVLDACFEAFNDGSNLAQRFLNYSMSVGDIIEIDDVAYRCLPSGWAKV